MLKILTLRLCFIALFFVAGLWGSASSHAQTTGARISEIQITGTQRIEPATVLTYMDVRVGYPLNQETMDKALKSLFATGLFADVTLHQKGTVLRVVVSENPVISQISFEGNSKIEDEELLAEVSLRSRQVFTRTKVQADVNRLYQIYQRNGRFSADIDPKIIKLDQNRVNLVFEINEGDVTKVKTIRFVGNRHFVDNHLRSEISTKESRWYRFLSTDDRYDPDRVSFDQELLRRFYLSQGYADFRLVSSVAELSNDRNHFFLTFTVDEGERYRIQDIAIHSALRHFDVSVLKPHVTFEKGEWYNADEVTKSIDKFTDVLGDLQFAFVSVRPEIKRNREEKTIDISFVINETPRVFVERINIRGNVRTLDKVVRRQMNLVEGDPFNRSKLARSEKEIKDLAFFDDVTITPLQGSAPDKTVLDVEVTEKSTGELSLGAGFSTTLGPLVDATIRERNLLGKGQDLSLSSTIAGKRSEFNLSFTEPYFLNRDFSAGFDLFHITRNLQSVSSFSQRRTGGGLRFGYPLSDKWRQNLRYRIERNDITNVAGNASRFVQDQEGQRVTSAVSQRTTYDNRDSTLFPTRGLQGWFDTELAGLGGDTSYLSGKLGANYYYPVTEKLIFNVLGEGGAIKGTAGSNVQINERYFLGGTNMRGFRRAGLGPHDTVTGDSLGGNYFYRGTAEFSFPVGLPEEMGVKGHSFTDVGSLWGLDNANGANIQDVNSLRAAAGVGVSWRSPLGPIRVDLSFPYLKEDFDRTETFRFNFGTRF